MQTQCNESRIEFHGLSGRVLIADFDGGNIVSDGGVPLVAEVDRMFRVMNLEPGDTHINLGTHNE